MKNQAGMPARRTDPRRERTRLALLKAAQKLLAEGRSSASIQDITTAAGVGFGSFFNHFDSKEALFEAAVDSVLASFDQVRAVVVERVSDPAEIFALGFRLTGRLQRSLPEYARILLSAGVRVLHEGSGGLPDSVRRDLQAALDAGKIDIDNIDLAASLTGGAMLGLLDVLDRDPSVDAGSLTDETTCRVLRMFGVNKEEAQRLCALPLPELPINYDDAGSL